MKKVLFLFIISLFTFQTLSFAQFDKGKFLVIGSLDLTNEKLRYDNNQIAGSNSTIIYPIFVRETSFEINPTLGYFVSDLWAIGLSGGIGFGKKLIIVVRKKLTFYPILILLRLALELTIKYFLS